MSAILYKNSDGESCVQKWSVDDLHKAFKFAEETDDDILYFAVIKELERRHLIVIDSNPPRCP